MPSHHTSSRCKYLLYLFQEDEDKHDTNEPISKAPTRTTRYSIPYFMNVRYDLTLDQLKESAAEIRQQIPTYDVPKTNSNEVASEFLSPSFSCVSHDLHVSRD